MIYTVGNSQGANVAPCEPASSKLWLQPYPCCWFCIVRWHKLRSRLAGRNLEFFDHRANDNVVCLLFAFKCHGTGHFSSHTLMWCLRDIYVRVCNWPSVFDSFMYNGTGDWLGCRALLACLAGCLSWLAALSCLAGLLGWLACLAGWLSWLVASSCLVGLLGWLLCCVLLAWLIVEASPLYNVSQMSEHSLRTGGTGTGSFVC